MKSVTNKISGRSQSDSPTTPKYEIAFRQLPDVCRACRSLTISPSWSVYGMPLALTLSSFLSLLSLPLSHYFRYIYFHSSSCQLRFAPFFWTNTYLGLVSRYSRNSVSLSTSWAFSKLISPCKYCLHSKCLLELMEWKTECLIQWELILSDRYFNRLCLPSNFPLF